MTMPAASDIRKWFALYTKPQQEFKASLQLEGKEIEYYLPTITHVRQWSDRKKKIQVPLFRGYVFIHTTEKEKWRAIQQSSVVRIVGFNGKPSCIPDWEIENVKKLLEKSPEVFVSHQIELGTKVRIIDGPFNDVVGVVCKRQEEKWFCVSIELLRQTVMVRLTEENIVQILEN
ncbi:MAG: UpxY family transcription antiterminator [Bacteroidetes bacterium]|nr:UpxY family transcription antiterminator [Bacteroidota bacterium]MCL6099646.1 UpxY family transcription antiterminator [Bacteroidota bacterium]